MLSSKLLTQKALYAQSFLLGSLAAYFHHLGRFKFGFASGVAALPSFPSFPSLGSLGAALVLLDELLLFCADAPLLGPLLPLLPLLILHGCII